jgi:hypothetical protein
MEILDKSQSEILKLLSSGSISYQTLNDSQKSICAFLVSLGYALYDTVSKSKSQNGVFQHWSEIETVKISEKGKMYLINEQLSEENRIHLKEQLDSLKNIADSAMARADIAKAQADSAKRDALFSKCISIIAIFISVAAIIVPLIL